MGLLDGLLGGGLNGALGQAEAVGMPALISAALAKANLGDLQGLVTQLHKGASARRSSPGSGAVKICQSRPINFAPRWAATK